jgi:hypothetical protein
MKTSIARRAKGRSLFRFPFSVGRGSFGTGERIATSTDDDGDRRDSANETSGRKKRDQTRGTASRGEAVTLSDGARVRTWTGVQIYLAQSTTVRRVGSLRGEIEAMRAPRTVSFVVMTGESGD